MVVVYIFFPLKIPVNNFFSHWTKRILEPHLVDLMLIWQSKSYFTTALLYSMLLLLSDYNSKSLGFGGQFLLPGLLDSFASIYPQPLLFLQKKKKFIQRVKSAVMFNAQKITFITVSNVYVNTTRCGGVVHGCNSSTYKLETEGSRVQVHTQLFFYLRPA